MNLFGNMILIPRSTHNPRCILYIALGPLMRSNCNHHIPCKVHSHLLCRTTAKTVVVVEHRPLICYILFWVRSCPVVSCPCMCHHCLRSTNNNLHSRIRIPFRLTLTADLTFQLADETVRLVELILLVVEFPQSNLLNRKQTFLLSLFSDCSPSCAVLNR